MDLNQWNETAPKAEVSLELMDQMIREYKQKRDEYDRLTKIAKEAWEPVQEIQDRILAALEAAGKKSYKVDGLGTFSTITKHSVKIPDTLEKKRELFSYIKETYGEDAFDSLVAIHHGTLNSFYNQELEKHQNDPLFQIPGIEAPTAKKEPRFTPSR